MFTFIYLVSVQVPDAFLEAKEELSLPVGDVSECRTKCRDETRFVCRYETIETLLAATKISLNEHRHKKANSS